MSLRALRVRGLALGTAAAVTAAGVPAMSVLTASSARAAGTPGVAAAPTVLFTEGFENRSNPATQVSLANYTGAAGETYAADTYWLNRVHCNGFILAYNNPTRQGNDCNTSPANPDQSYARLRSLAYALGQLNGTGTNKNSVLAGYTNGDPGTAQRELETVTPVTLPAGGHRFIGFSVNSAAVNCDKNHPLYQFQALDGSTATNLGSVIDGCSTGGSDVTVPDPSGTTVKAHVGAYATDAGLLFSGSQLGLRLLNTQSSGLGNDGAVDDIRILDVTPKLDKAFSPTVLPAGSTSTLTFTITNTGELGAKSGWSFTDALPAGLTLTSQVPTTTCSRTTVDAPSGSRNISVTGDLDKGQQACTVSVSVTGDTGTYTNGAANTTEVGLDPPGDAPVEFRPLVDLRVGKTASAASYVPGQPFTYMVTVTNRGPATATGAKVADPLPTALQGFTWTCAASAGGSCAASGAGPVSDTVTIPKDGSVTYTVTGTVPAGTTGTLKNTATVTPPENVFDPTCAPTCEASTETPQEPASPGLTLVKSVAPADGASFTEGRVLTYTLKITNTGNVPLTNITAADTAFTGSGTPPNITCPSTSADPGATVTCTGTYTVTATDVTTGKIDNTAKATGRAPDGTVVDDTDSAEVPVVSAALTLVKSVDPPTALKAGDAETYTFTVTNTGTVPVTDPAITETAFSGSGTTPKATCPGGTLAPKAFVTCTAAYTVTQADVDAGEVTNTATASATPPEGVTAPTSNKASAEVKMLRTAALSVVKSVDPSLVAGAGKPVSYSFAITNTGTVTLSGIAITETAFSGSGGAPAASCPSGNLVPGSTATCTADYTVTQADADAGRVTNTATATATPPEGLDKPVSPPSSSQVLVPPAPALVLVKTAEPERVTRAGARVRYAFTAENTGNVTITGLKVSDNVFSGTGPLPDVTCAATTLAVGEHTTCETAYRVTQADVNAGKVTNVAVAAGTAPGDKEVISNPATATVAAPARPGLRLVKTASPGTVAKAGTRIVYTLTVTNTGNVTLDAVKVAELRFTGSGTVRPPDCPATARTLAPGESAVCRLAYTVTADDLRHGSIANTAIVTARTPAGSETRATASATVRVHPGACRIPGTGSAMGADPGAACRP